MPRTADIVPEGAWPPQDPPAQHGAEDGDVDSAEALAARVRDLI